MHVKMPQGVSLSDEALAKALEAGAASAVKRQATFLTNRVNGWDFAQAKRSAEIKAAFKVSAPTESSDKEATPATETVQPAETA